MKTLGELDFSPDPPAVSRDVMLGQIGRFLTVNGLRYFSFIVTQRGTGGSINPAVDLITNYQSEWVERYCTQHYEQLDPLIQRSRTDSKPIIWGSDSYVRDLCKRQAHFFYEARSFGIQCGCSFPIRSIDGSIGLVTYTADADDLLSDVLDQRGARLLIAAHQIMDSLADTPLTADDGNPLSVREREALIWVTEGLTSEEIADRMSVSVPAVNYHMSNATRKLSARNRHHAALIALKEQHI